MNIIASNIYFILFLNTFYNYFDLLFFSDLLRRLSNNYTYTFSILNFDLINLYSGMTINFILIPWVIVLIYMYSSFMHLKGFSSIINIILVLFLYIILTVLSLSSHFLVTYLSLEAITFIMSALFVHNSKYDPTAELVLKYFTLSIFGTIFFLVGIGLVYLENKTLSYSDLKYFLNDFTFFDINNSFTKLSVIFILIGFLFKLNCAVFHFWSIEIYGNLSWLNLFIVLVPIKLSMFHAFFKTIFVFFNAYIEVFSNVCNFFGILSVIIGTIGAVFQEKLKSFIVYTSISHSGYILLALSSNSFEGIRAALGHLHGYIFTSSLFFLFIGLYFVKVFDRIEYINDFKKVFLKESKVLVYSVSFLILSFAGMPPFIGFFTKVDILITYYNSGNTFFTLLVLLSSVISVLYYFSIILEIFSRNYKLSDVAPSAQRATMEKIINELLIEDILNILKKYWNNNTLLTPQRSIVVLFSTIKDRLKFQYDNFIEDQDIFVVTLLSICFFVLSFGCDYFMSSSFTFALDLFYDAH